MFGDTHDREHPVCVRYLRDHHARAGSTEKRRGTRHAQYPANAELFCARKEFAGAHYSAGDEYIWNVGSHKQPGPGTRETWLRAGINHHLVLTARQISGAVAMTT
jgi:hypothetical protein